MESLRDAARISPQRTRELEARLTHVQTSLSTLSTQNERLVRTLKDAREQIVTLKKEVDRLAQPPSTYGLVIDAARGRRGRHPHRRPQDAGRRQPLGRPAELGLGREVMLNEALNVVSVHGYERVGEVVTVKERSTHDRVVVVTHGDEERVCRLANPLLGEHIRVGDSLTLDPRSNFVHEVIPKLEVEELVLEEVPDVAYEDIGGLAGQIEQIRDAVELPFLHPELYKEHALKPPKGVLLYGPPGCGKTLIAKAVAASLARQVAAAHRQADGEELLPQHQGPGAAQQVRRRDRAAHPADLPAGPREGFRRHAVVVFFDEMDSLFRTRGSGVSSDVETTIVPQLLAEIDGVERLDNVIVIGASNREDMIDPAILRPGRLDAKIKIERPDAESARDIFSKYLIESLPLHEHDLAVNGGDRDATVEAMITAAVERMYSEMDENRFLEVTYQGGDKEILYFKDFNSGRDDPEHRRPGQEARDQGLPDDRPEGHPRRAPDDAAASTSSRRTRTCPTRPTPTTGPGSAARRASGSSTSARSSRARTAPSRAARSPRQHRPVPLTERSTLRAWVAGRMPVSPVVSCRTVVSRRDVSRL